MKSTDDIRAFKTEQLSRKNKTDIAALNTKLNTLSGNAVTYVTTMPTKPVNNQVVVYMGTTTEEYTKGRMYQYDGDTWQDTQLGAFPVPTVSNFRAPSIETTVNIRWKDPDDVIVDGVPIAQWFKTVIVKKTTGFPADLNDGTVVVTSTVRNQYATLPLKDTVAEGATNYYRAFVYTTTGILNADDTAVCQTGVLTWPGLVDMCEDPDVDMRDVLQAGDILPALNSVRSSDGNGGYEWQVTDVTHDDFGLLSYKIVDRLKFNPAQKEYALTEDTVFHPEYILKRGTDRFLIEDKSATGTDRVWIKMNGANQAIVWANDRWEFRARTIPSGTINASPQQYQTTVTEDPWDPAAVWSSTSYSCTMDNQYYTKSGDTYTAAAVTAGEPIPADTYYEYNPGGNNVVLYGSNLYINNGVPCHLDPWLNTGENSEPFWKPMSPWDNPPSWEYDKNGFMYGFDPEFLDAVKPTTFKVNLNAFHAGGTSITLTRKFYLLSREEVGINPYHSAYPEGTALELYRGATDADRIKYRATDGGVNQWWLRSPTVGGSHTVYLVNTSGVLSGTGASYTLGVVPACRIGKSTLQ